MAQAVRAAAAALIPCLVVAACGGGTPTPTCTPSELDLAFAGTVALPSGQQAITLQGRYSDGLIASANYGYLVNVLFRGRPTSGASAVFEVYGSSLDIALIFQLGGGRAKGRALPLLGILDQGLAPGQGPVISALSPDGFLVLFGNDSYRAASGSGSLVVKTAAPLTGHLALQFHSAQGLAAGLDGDLTVTGIGCP